MRTRMPRVKSLFAVVPFGDKIVVQPLPEKPEEELAKLTKEIVFDREARKKASKFLISQSKQYILSKLKGV